jgi:hypothetical protein
VVRLSPDLVVVSDSFIYLNEVLGNANLISSSPELLDALTDAVCALECCGKDYDYVIGKARAAIRKAAGEEE